MYTHHFFANKSILHFKITGAEMTFSGYVLACMHARIHIILQLTLTSTLTPNVHAVRCTDTCFVCMLARYNS